MKLGNLDNLNLGMGLSAKADQVLPAKYATLQGWGEQEMESNLIWTLLSGVAAVYVMYRLFS